MDFQKTLDDLPPQLKFILAKRTMKQREDMIVLKAIEDNIDKAEDILVSAGVPTPKPCKKCWERWFVGKRNGVPLLCKCVSKNLRRREGKLLINWESLDGKARGEEGKATPIPK